jgi:hypothetical protein
MGHVTPLDAIRAVMASQLDASTGHVLIAWSSHVDADGKAWPGAKRLSELTRLSERTVRASMGLARRSGILLSVGTHASGTLIERLDLDALAGWEPAEHPQAAAKAANQPNGGASPNTPPAVVAPPATLAPPAVAAPTPCNPCTHPLQPLQDPPAVVAPKGVIEEVKEEDREEDMPPADPPPAIRKQLDLTPPVAAASDEWAQLAAHYASLPGCMKPRDRKNGNGEHLDTILRKAGSLAAAVNLLEWWMYAPGARQLRTGSHDGSESDAAPVYGLKTLARPKNTDGYLEQALSWAKQRNPPRRKLSSASTERPPGRAPPIVETPDHVIKPVRLPPLPPPLKPRKP